jgi:hypothetical protein
MSRRALYQDLAAVRGMVAAGRERVGELDEYWINSARVRLESVDEVLIAAAGGLGPWTRTTIGAGAMLAGAFVGAVITREAIVAWVLAAVVQLPARRWAARKAPAIARRRLEKAAQEAAGQAARQAAGQAARHSAGQAAERAGEETPGAAAAEAAGDAGGRLADLPELLARARVRLVSAALREAGSKHWEVPYLRRLMTVEPTMLWLAQADGLLCQSIDYLEEYLAAERKDPL